MRSRSDCAEATELDESARVAGVIDLKRRVGDPELLSEEVLELTASLMAIFATAD